MKNEFDIMTRISTLKDDIEQLEREGSQSLLGLMIIEAKRARLQELRWIVRDD